MSVVSSVVPPSTNATTVAQPTKKLRKEVQKKHDTELVDDSEEQSGDADRNLEGGPGSSRVAANCNGSSHSALPPTPTTFTLTAPTQINPHSSAVPSTERVISDSGQDEFEKFSGEEDINADDGNCQLEVAMAGGEDSIIGSTQDDGKTCKVLGICSRCMQALVCGWTVVPGIYYSGHLHTKCSAALRL
ncbi:uncharacterized protein LOC144123500 [Amblyomma americanum]